MRWTAGLALTVALTTGVAGGCAAGGSDARLAALEADVKALREDIAALRRAVVPPPIGVSDVAPDPEMTRRLLAWQSLGADADQRLAAEVFGLKEKLARLDGLAGTVQELKGEVEKLRR